MDWSETISNSERSTAGCLQKWFFRYGLGLTAPMKPLAMYRGIVWHEALELLAKHGLDVALKALGEMGALHVQSTGQHFLEDPADVIDTFNLIEDMLVRYVDHWRDVGAWKVLNNELRVESRVICPTGNKSSATGYMGRIDKVVQLTEDQPELDLDGDGSIWIVEHKSTRLPLLDRRSYYDTKSGRAGSDWWSYNSYKPQVPTYAWLLLRDKGIRAQGVIYDVALAKSPLPWTSFDVLKDGSRLAKVKGLPATTADEWAKAIINNGFSFNDQDWYLEVGKQLRKRDREGFWFKRFCVRLTDAEIKRAGEELYTEATRLRRMKQACVKLRADIKAAADDPSSFCHAVASAAKEHGSNFPRNFGQCRMFNRPCEFTELCRDQTPQAAGRFVLRERKDEFIFIDEDEE